MNEYQQKEPHTRSEGLRRWRIEAFGRPMLDALGQIA